MKVVVLGGRGSIGSAVVKALEAQGAKVKVVDVEDSISRHMSGDLVIHAAACKFVEVCERDPKQCVQDNLLTTWDALFTLPPKAKLVFLSTDKACQPINLMGYAKRLSEAMVLQAGGSVIRLVNVKETRGNVFALWDKQQAEGKPLTVTDKRMRRYFMTLQEAVWAILKVVQEPSGLYAYMPYTDESIWELALARKNPAGVIEIGPRPGDKLTESLTDGGIWDRVEGALWKQR